MITEGILRRALSIAIKSKEVGLIIWSSSTLWHDYSTTLKPGNKNHDLVAEKLSTKTDIIVNMDNWNGISNIPAFIAFPVENAIQSKIYFKYLLNQCKENCLDGPIVFFTPKNSI